MNIKRYLLYGYFVLFALSGIIFAFFLKVMAIVGHQDIWDTPLKVLVFDILIVSLVPILHIAKPEWRKLTGFLLLVGILTTIGFPVYVRYYWWSWELYWALPIISDTGSVEIITVLLVGALFLITSIYSAKGSRILRYFGIFLAMWTLLTYFYILKYRPNRIWFTWRGVLNGHGGDIISIDIGGWIVLIGILAAWIVPLLAEFSSTKRRRIPQIFLMASLISLLVVLYRVHSDQYFFLPFSMLASGLLMPGIAPFLKEKGSKISYLSMVFPLLAVLFLLGFNESKNINDSYVYAIFKPFLISFIIFILLIILMPSVVFIAREEVFTLSEHQATGVSPSKKLKILNDNFSQLSPSNLPQEAIPLYDEVKTSLSEIKTQIKSKNKEKAEELLKNADLKLQEIKRLMNEYNQLKSSILEEIRDILGETPEEEGKS